MMALKSIISRQYFKTAALFLGILLFQVNILPAVWPLGVKPDLLLVLAAALAVNSPVLNAAIAGLSCGMSKDLLAMRFFGFNSLAFTLDALAISFICRYLYKEKLGFTLIVLAGATLFNYLLLSLIAGKLYLKIGLMELPLNCIFLIPIAKLHYAICSKKDGLLLR